MTVTQTDLHAAILHILGTFEPYRGGRANADSAIMGRLDSLSLVGFLVDVERHLEEQHGITLSLTDELLALQDNPLATVKQFTRYLEERAKKAP